MREEKIPDFQNQRRVSTEPQSYHQLLGLGSASDELGGLSDGEEFFIQGSSWSSYFFLTADGSEISSVQFLDQGDRYNRR